jgi:Cdc6-like AAA superfamily ATPase
VPDGPRHEPSTDLGRACAALALTAPPRRMPCRDVERAQITQFVEQALLSGTAPTPLAAGCTRGATLTPCCAEALLLPGCWQRVCAGCACTVIAVCPLVVGISRVLVSMVGARVRFWADSVLACARVQGIHAGDDALGGCLYVSGVPGTGKTATVMEVMRKLRRRAESQQLPLFQFVEINGLRLPSPYHAYSRLYEVLSSRQLRTALLSLEAMGVVFGKNQVAE